MAISITAQPGGVVLSKNPINYRVTCSGFASLANYRVEVVVTVGGIDAAPLRTYPSAAGFIDLDLSDVVDAVLTAQLPENLPRLAAGDHYVLDQVRSLRVTFKEIYGEPPAEESSLQSTLIKTMSGGVDAYQFPGTPYWTRQTDAKSYTAWLPNRRKVGRDQPIFLGWTPTAGPAQATLEVVWYTNAGLSVVGGTIGAPLSLDRGQIAIYQVGPTQLGLGNDVAYYRVRLNVETESSEIGGGTIELSTQWREFTIDPLPHRDNHYLIAMNVWGCPETIRCTGRRNKTPTFSPETVTRPLARGYANNARQTVQRQHNLGFDYVYNTGLISERELDAIAGLLAEGRLWVVDGLKLKAVLPQGLRKIDGLDSRADSYSLDIEVTRSLDPRNYTPDPQDSANDPTPYWLEPDNSIWTEPSGTTNWQNP